MAKASDKLGKEINELNKLLDEVTIPYRGTDKHGSKQKGGTKKTSGPRGSATQLPTVALPVADQIKLETIKGENLAKEIELSRLQLELAKCRELGSIVVGHQPIWSSTPGPVQKDVADFDIPSLQQLRQHGVNSLKEQKGKFLPGSYLFSTKGTAVHDKLDILEFICGFLEMIKASEDKWKSTLVDYLHLIMEKAIHYQWFAVQNFHHAISSAVEQNRFILG